MWYEYDRYMESYEWRVKRDNYIRHMEERICECCGIPDYPEDVRKEWGSKLHLHHRHYKSFKNEKFVDLVMLCKYCHECVHRLAKDTNTTTFKATEFMMQKKYEGREIVDMLVERRKIKVGKFEVVVLKGLDSEDETN